MSSADTSRRRSDDAAERVAGPSVRRLATALAAACITLLAADVVLGGIASLAATPNSYDVPRNPNFRRGWTDYTAPRPRPDGTRLVIVISNSQGFLRENRDGALAYPALLEDLLEADDHGEVIVANWSVAGGQAPEMTVLAARAAQHRPDLVVLVTSAGNFSPLWADQPLSYWISDATDLAYLPEVRENLSEEFLERTSADDPLSWLSARTGIGRARKRFVEKRDEAWTWRDDAPTRLGDVVERTLDQRGEGFTLGVAATPKSAESAPPASDSEREAGTSALLGELVRTLRTNSPQTRLLVVSMPVARPEHPAAAWYAAAEFYAIAERALADQAGVTVIDAIDVVPPEHFVRATHLRPAGHRLVAEWLLPHANRVLAGDDGPG